MKRLLSIRIYKAGHRCYVWADHGGWGDGPGSKTRMGALIKALRA
jgi:hypothetical protein